MILCKLCRKEFENYKSLSCHLRKHKITSKEYYDRFLKKEDEGICSVCGKETFYQNLNKGYCRFCSHKCASKGENHPNYGKHPSEETRQRMSDAKKGKHLSEETKQKMTGKKNPFYGKHHSEESKQKMSRSRKGKMAGKNNPMYGKHHSEETKEKISQSREGKTAGERNPMYSKHHSEETRKKISDAHKGKHPSEETKKKLSDAKKGENHPNYKNGISMKEFKESHGLDKSEWKILAQKIRIRDRFTCQYCGKKNATDVHHIIPRRIKIDNSPENLITLCKSCHQKIEHLTDKYLAEGKDPIEIFYEKWSD